LLGRRIQSTYGKGWILCVNLELEGRGKRTKVFWANMIVKADFPVPPSPTTMILTTIGCVQSLGKTPFTPLYRKRKYLITNLNKKGEMIRLIPLHKGFHFVLPCHHLHTLTTRVGGHLKENGFPKRFIFRQPKKKLICSSALAVVFTFSKYAKLCR